MDPLPQSPCTYSDVIDDWCLEVQSLNFIERDMPICSSPWTGMAPFATDSLAAEHSSVPGPSSSAIPLPFPEELAWLLQAEQSVPVSASSSDAGQVTSEYGTNLNDFMALIEPTLCSAAPSIQATAGNADIELATTSMSDIAHGKRSRNAESYGDIGPVVAEDYEAQLHKGVEGEASNGTLEAAQYMAGAHCKPETRVRTIKNNNTSEETGRGAEGLATPIAQGVYHHSLTGPSFQQDWALENAQRQGQKFPWVEERVEEEALHHMATTAQQEAGDLFQIPSNFHEGYRILLAATRADWTRGAVDEIKCRLCHDSWFTKWEDFKRHCKVTEAHPLEISFCEHCGDFFARTDSLKRHRSRPPYECLNVTSDRAEEKRRETEREHGEFMGRVERSLTTGEEIGAPFAHIIKQKYPESSKKRTGSGWERRRVLA